jgi:hypothetical protein
MQNGVAQNPGELNKRVEALADNLKKQGSWFKSKYIAYIIISQTIYNFSQICIINDQESHQDLMLLILWF